MTKIAAERADLAKAIHSLEAEQEGLLKRAERLSGEIEDVDRQLDEVNRHSPSGLPLDFKIA